MWLLFKIHIEEIVPENIIYKLTSKSKIIERFGYHLYLLKKMIKNTKNNKTNYKKYYLNYLNDSYDLLP